jgi:transcriptional regulator with XRE-family HTH domain/DNA polymerase III delta prime subunit
VIKFAALLRDVRSAAGMTLRDLAERSGYAHSTMCMAERGVKLPSWGVAEAFIQACGANPAGWHGLWTAASVELERGLLAVPQRAEPGDRPGAWLESTPPPAAVSGQPQAGQHAVTQVVPAQLPHAVLGFAGRQTELGHLTMLSAAVADSASPGTAAILAVTGPPGVGKTELALFFAHQLAGRFAHGQLYLDLRGFDRRQRSMPASDALYYLLWSLGVDPGRIPVDRDMRAALYRSVLAGKRVLIVLDNARDEEQVRSLLPASAGCMTVVTSRMRLRGLVSGNGASRISLGPLGAAEAVELLGRVVGADRIAADPAAAAEVARVCEYLPLALRVAAERLALRPYQTIADLVDQLASERDRLDLLSDQDDERTSIRAVFSWSYRALPRDAARLFRRLGMHVGTTITTRGAAALIGSPVADVRGPLGTLADAHLIEQVAPERYRLSSLLRLYAIERATIEDAGLLGAAGPVAGEALATGYCKQASRRWNASESPSTV